MYKIVCIFQNLSYPKQLFERNQNLPGAAQIQF